MYCFSREHSFPQPFRELFFRNLSVLKPKRSPHVSSVEELTELSPRFGQRPDVDPVESLQIQAGNPKDLFIPIGFYPVEYCDYFGDRQLGPRLFHHNLKIHSLSLSGPLSKSPRKFEGYLGRN